MIILKRLPLVGLSATDDAPNNACTQTAGITPSNERLSTPEANPVSGEIIVPPAAGKAGR